MSFLISHPSIAPVAAYYIILRDMSIDLIFPWVTSTAAVDVSKKKIWFFMSYTKVWILLWRIAGFLIFQFFFFFCFFEWTLWNWLIGKINLKSWRNIWVPRLILISSMEMSQKYLQRHLNIKKRIDNLTFRNLSKKKLAFSVDTRMLGLPSNKNFI